MNITWRKPDGGEAIDNYTLQWTAITTGNTFNNVTDHINGKQTYSYIQTGLTPGESYEIIISTSNEAGNSFSLISNDTRHTTSK